VRVSLDFSQTDGFTGGNRFYLSYTGSAPTVADCNTLATTIRTAWGSHIAPTVNSDWSLTLVDVLDIASYSGNSGSDAIAAAGTASGTPLAAQLSSNVEFKIKRRYRGGKPRIYSLPGVDADMQNPSEWTDGHVTGIAAAYGAFFGAINGAGPGSMGTLQHVNVSYYSSFTNIANTSGRERAVPKYRTTAAVVDDVTAYIGKKTISSQRRRRLATTP